MKKLITALLFIVVLLPLSYAEGQVKINPDSQESTNLSLGNIVSNDSWLVATLNYGNAFMVKNRNTNEWRAYWLDNGLTVSEFTSNAYLFGNTLIISGSRDGGQFPIYRSDVVGIYDLANPMPYVDRTRYKNWELNPNGHYITQNTTIKHFGIKFMFADDVNGGIIGVFDADGWFTAYSTSGKILQEIFVGDDVESVAASDGFAGFGNGQRVQLYEFDKSIDMYEHIDTYKPTVEPDSTGRDTEYGGYYRLGLTTKEDRLYLAVGTDRFWIDRIEINTKTMKVSSRKVVYTNGFNDDRILSCNKELAVVGDRILHLPSGIFIGEISFNEKLNTKSGHRVEAFIRDLGNKAEVFTTETLMNEYGDIAIYEEDIYEVSVPKKVNGGSVTLLTSPRIFSGDSAAFAVVANSGKRIHLIKEKNGPKKKFKDQASKWVAGAIHKITKITKDTGVKRVRFRKADMPEHFVPAGYTKIVGLPEPDGEPRKWSYEIPAGIYVGIIEATNGPPQIVEIRVKPKGSVKTVPANFN